MWLTVFNFCINLKLKMFIKASTKTKSYLISEIIQKEQFLWQK